VTSSAWPAWPGRPARLRPVPWRGMAWITWRQHRIALAAAVALAGLASAYLLVTGLQMHHAYAAATACHPAGSGACTQAVSHFFQTYSPGAGIVAGLLQTLPALTGVFTAAPVLARELETGSFRYTWTQGFGRTRWTIAKLVPLAAAVTVMAGAVGLVFSWYARPFTSTPGQGQSSLAPGLFDLTGVAIAAWTLAAFSIGALAGALIRRVVPALVAALAAWGGLAFATGAFLRQHYQAPLVTTSTSISTPAWVIRQWWTVGGKPASLDMMNRAFHAVDIQAVTLNIWQPGPDTPATVNPVTYLVQHGFRQFTRFQPGSRFWPFQWIESGWLLALCLLLIAATVWLVRRRVA
jgi:hypothetical protein